MPLSRAQSACPDISHSDVSSSPTARGNDARPQRIVHVITRLLLGGAEENTVATCLHQASCGHRVTLIYGPGAAGAWAGRVGDRIEMICMDTLVHPISPRADLAAVRDLYLHFRQVRPDVVHTHESKAGIVGRVAAAAARVPLIVHTIHIAPFVAVSGARRRLYIAAERACARLSHALIAVSRGMQQAYLDAGIGGGIPITVVHSGMALEAFSSARAPADWRARVGGGRDGDRPRFILKTAAFEERKRQRPLLRAMAPGLRERDDVFLLFAGDGPDRPDCEAEARSLGIADRVRFLGHDPAPWELVALADLCVHASEREGLPRTAVQAIAGGKPLMVARLPGIEEIIADGVNGIVTQADDLSGLAAQAFALLDSPDRLARLQAGARSTDVSSWGLERMGERIDRAYAAASAKRAAPRRRIATIEFLGLPASGKTTIARQLLGLVREDRAPVPFTRTMMGVDEPFLRRSLRRFALVVPAFLRAPKTMILASRGLTPDRPGGKDALKTRWNFLSVLAMELRRPDRGLLIADEGIAQGAWTARMHHGDRAAPIKPLAGRLDRWIGETLFVHVEAPPSVARERLARRQQRTSRFQRPEYLQDAALWSRGKAVIDRIAGEIDDELRRRGLGGRMLRIAGAADETPSDCAKRIRDYLHHIDCVDPE